MTRRKTRIIQIFVCKLRIGRDESWLGWSDRLAQWILYNSDILCCLVNGDPRLPTSREYLGTSSGETRGETPGETQGETPGETQGETPAMTKSDSWGQIK
jgi:hypothetical protein